MAQTTDGMSARNLTIETSPDGSAWTDISGFANSVEVDGGERDSEETFTFDGATPIRTVGKRHGYELTVKIVYTEGASDPAEVIRQAYENGTDFYLRWSPKGGNSGDFMYTTGAGWILSPTYPSGDAGSAAAMGIEFKVTVNTITKSVVA